MKNEQGKFKIIIINNENGKKIVNKNTNGIMLVYTKQEGVCSTILTHSSIIEIMGMIESLQKIIKNQTEKISKYMIKN